jgi:hypothetical protein
MMERLSNRLFESNARLGTWPFLHPNMIDGRQRLIDKIEIEHRLRINSVKRHT